MFTMCYDGWSGSACQQLWQRMGWVGFLSLCFLSVFFENDFGARKSMVSALVWVMETKKWGQGFQSLEMLSEGLQAQVLIIFKLDTTTPSPFYKRKKNKKMLIWHLVQGNGSGFPIPSKLHVSFAEIILCFCPFVSKVCFKRSLL